ncbi:MAG: phosphodiester glycosidase family protein [Lachnospiraceae bacterium]|nr:phosphodiester glycosidase family protein [Lachnospiraceae bacterium]
MDFDTLINILERGAENTAAVCGSFNSQALLLYRVILGLFGLEVLFVTLHSCRSRQRMLSGVVSAACSCAALFLCLLAYESRTLVFMPSEEPEASVERFFDTFLEGDRAAAEKELSKPLVVREADTSDVNGRLFAEALSDSFSWESLGECELQGTHAVSRVKISYLKCGDMTGDIHGVITEELERLVSVLPRKDVYDDNDNYRKEILEDTYTKAVRVCLADAKRYRESREVEIPLDYVEGRWVITPTEELSLALSGGISPLEDFETNMKSEALSGLVYIPKHYVIAEGATEGPVPEESRFIVTDDLQEVHSLIDEASDLTEGYELFFNDDCDFYSDFAVYHDETILTVSWKEMWNRHECAFTEIFIADASQFRRKLAENTFASPVQKSATMLAAETNAVVASNADFYKYRPEGITIYDSELYRFNPQNVDICYIDRKGDLIMSFAGEIKTEEEMKKYIKEKDITFSLAFGPVEVYEGKLCKINTAYPLGEVNDRYSRSAIGQRGERHYLLMNINNNKGFPGTNIYDAAQLMYEKGCYNAYALDGGQTAEIVFQNRIYNMLNHNHERMVSDIIYFCTALPENDRR